MAVWATGVWADDVWADNVWFGMGGGTPAVAEVQRGGTSSRRKKRGRVIRYSDFRSRDEYEKALAAAVVFTPVVPEVFQADDDSEDDEALIEAITLTMLQ